MLFDRMRLGSGAALLTALMVVSMAGTATAAEPTRVTGAEKYALSLLNCTRTGGWVTAKGVCKGRGSGKYSSKRAPLKLSKGISRKVAWPWASALTSAKTCGHVLVGMPVLSERLASKGFGNAGYGENAGCGWGGATPKQVVLSTHRLMQAEKSYGGGHWRNMKKAGYRSVGIGVATSNGRTSVVYDFYAKRVY